LIQAKSVEFLCKSSNLNLGRFVEYQNETLERRGLSCQQNTEPLAVTINGFRIALCNNVFVDNSHDDLIVPLDRIRAPLTKMVPLGRAKEGYNFCCEIFLLAFAATVLTFFIAGLVFDLSR
jgi:hypothetical protein